MMRRVFLAASSLVAILLIAVLAQRVPLPLPVPAAPNVGWAILGVAVALLIASLFAERAERDAPPTGIALWVPEPGLVGAPLLALGAALTWSSSFTFWVVTPAVATAALIFAFDNEAAPHWLHRRFPVYLLALLPSYLVYASFGMFSASNEPWWSDYAWPRTPFTLSHFALVALAPLVCKRAWLPTVAHQLLVVTGIIVAAVIALPLMPLPAPLSTDIDGRAAFHVAWAFAGAAAWSSQWPRMRILFGVWAMAVAVSCVLLGAPLLEILTGLGAYALSEWKVPQTWRQIPARIGGIPLRLPLAFTVWAAGAAWLMGARFDWWALAASAAVAGCAALVVSAADVGDFIGAAAGAIAGVRMWELGFTLPSVAGICVLVFAIVLLRDPSQRLGALALIVGAGILLALHVPVYALTTAPTFRVAVAAAVAALLTGLWQARRRS